MCRVCGFLQSSELDDILDDLQNSQPGFFSEARPMSLPATVDKQAIMNDILQITGEGGVQPRAVQSGSLSLSHSHTYTHSRTPTKTLNCKGPYLLPESLQSS